MVRLFRRLVIGAALVLALSSCQLLFIGAFPSSIGQATGRADLSGAIDTGPATYFSLSCVTSGGSEYFVLFTNLNFDSSRVHIVILDSRLKTLNTFSLDDILAQPPGGVPLNGSFTMTDCLDQVVIGNVWFDVLPGGFTFSSKSAAISLSGPSAREQPQFNFNDARFRITGAGNLRYNQYDPSWTPTGTLGHLLGTPIPAPQGTLNLSDVFTDPNSSASPDVFVFQDGGNQSYFLQVPKPDISAGLPFGALDVFTYAAANYPPLVVRSNLDSASISFSRAGVVAYDQDSRALVRFTLDAPDKVSSLPVKWNNGMQAVAGVSGTCCVVWDPATRLLTRYDQWWQ